MAEERPTAASERRYQTRIAVLLAAAAVTTGLIGARTANLAGAAGGEWESAVRVQVKGSAARTTGELFVHGDAIPNVASFQKALIRSKEYISELERGDELTSAEFEALRVLALAQTTRAAGLRSSVTREEDYFEDETFEKFDLDRKLADQRRENVSGLEDPADVRTGGDDFSTHAAAEALAGLPAALAFLFGSVAQALGRGRKAVWWAGAIALATSVAAAVTLEVVMFR
jgi:hypothetical protein